MNSTHSLARAQQRGIPPMVANLLETYGEEAYDGHGALTIYFNKRSLRQMERDMGREPVRLLSRWHHCYMVISASDGCIITIGHRHKRLLRN